MNAVARVLTDPVAEWPPDLPWPQYPSVQVNWDQPADNIETLVGPTRFKLTHPNASPSWEFEIIFTAEECENFEAWYNEVIGDAGLSGRRDAALYLPWIGEGRIVYLKEYTLSPVGTGWKLHALIVQLYRDPDYVDRHVCDLAYAWRIPVLVDADEDYPITVCELPADLKRPRMTDRFFGKANNARLSNQFDATDRFSASLDSTNFWYGNTWGHDGYPGLLAMSLNTITAYLPATTLNYPIFIDIPENWMWDDHIEEWFLTSRMVYIDDWWSIWSNDLVNACRVLKDKLPPPWQIVADPGWDYMIPVPQPTLDFTATPSVMAGSTAVLTWTTTNANTVMASGGWSGNVGLSGTWQTGPLSQTTTYRLTASGPSGDPVTQSVEVVVLRLPTVTLTVSPASIAAGQSATLSWTTANANNIVASGSWSGQKATSGSESTGPLSGTSQFTLTVTGPGGGPVSQTVTVTPTVFESQVRVVAGAGGMPQQVGFFFGGPTTGGTGSVTPANLPAGGSALGMPILSLVSQPNWLNNVPQPDGYDLALSARLPAGRSVTQTNQFDSVSVVDDAGVTRTFQSSAAYPWSSSGGNSQPYDSTVFWWWEGTNRVMRTVGKTYVFTFRKAA